MVQWSSLKQCNLKHASEVWTKLTQMWGMNLFNPRYKSAIFFVTHETRQDCDNEAMLYTYTGDTMPIPTYSVARKSKRS